MTTSKEVTLSTEEVEDIMKGIEQGEGAGVEVPPVPPMKPLTSSIPGAAVVTEDSPVATSASPLLLREFVNPEQLKRDVEFNPNDLDEAVMSHASKFVFYADRARLARRQFERMKAACDFIESKLYAEHRERLLADGGKATEAMVANAVASDRRLFTAKNRLIDARAIYDFANDAREAFSQRKDMIVQISVDRRREKEGQLRVMSEESIKSGREYAIEQAAAASRTAAGMTGMAGS